MPVSWKPHPADSSSTLKNTLAHRILTSSDWFGLRMFKHRSVFRTWHLWHPREESAHIPCRWVWAPCCCTWQWASGQSEAMTSAMLILEASMVFLKEHEGTTAKPSCQGPGFRRALESLSCRSLVQLLEGEKKAMLSFYFLSLFFKTRFGCPSLRGAKGSNDQGPLWSPESAPFANPQRIGAIAKSLSEPWF